MIIHKKRSISRNLLFTVGLYDAAINGLMFQFMDDYLIFVNEKKMSKDYNNIYLSNSHFKYMYKIRQNKYNNMYINIHPFMKNVYNQAN